MGFSTEHCGENRPVGYVLDGRGIKRKLVQKPREKAGGNKTWSSKTLKTISIHLNVQKIFILKNQKNNERHVR